MNDLLKDELNLRLLENICSGKGVEVNGSDADRQTKSCNAVTKS